MKNFFAVLISLSLTACGHQVMTAESFSDIPIGTSKEELKKVAGSPYRVKKKKNGDEVYEYVEKFKIGDRTLTERHYYLIVREGRVVEKKVDTDSPPPFATDSYDMQTSSLDEEGQEESSQ